MPQVASIASAVLMGIEAIPVNITATVEPGIPSFTIVGAQGVLENDIKSMVRTAIRASGFEMPRSAVHVAVEPRASRLATSLELPMALAVLAASGQVDPKHFEDKLVVGSLGMSGLVGEVRGILSYMALAEATDKVLVAPPQSFHRFCGIPAHDLASVGLHPHASIDLDVDYNPCFVPTEFDGLPLTKLAMMCAAVGRHPLLLADSGFVNAWSVAHGIRQILPTLSEAEQYETDTIHSVCGAVPTEGRPVRTPHCSITLAGMVGGGKPILPGEVSLAHKGVLLMDDVEEFGNSVISSLDIAVSDSQVCIVRSQELVTLPSETAIVMSTQRHLATLPPAVTALAEIVIDMAEDINCSNELSVLGDLTFMEMADIVEAAIAFKTERVEYPNSISRSARETLEELCDDGDVISLDGQDLDKYKVLSVSRTLADIAQSQQVNEEHVRLAATLCGGRVLTHALSVDDKEPILFVDGCNYDEIVGPRLHERHPTFRRK